LTTDLPRSDTHLDVFTLGFLSVLAGLIPSACTNGDGRPRSATPGPDSGNAAEADTPSDVTAATVTRYILTTFKSDAAADEKLWVYTSPDATNFTVLSDTGYGGPTGVLRDPSIMKHTDGRYYVAFTTQSWTTASTSFAVGSSSDLVNWTTVATVDSGIANTHFTWAPEWYVEDTTVRLIVSIDDSGSGSNFRTFAYTAQDQTLTSWSEPVFIGISGYIDTFIVKVDQTYHALSKGATWIEHATATTVTGPWTWVGTGNWAGWGQGFEAPALVRLDDGSWRVYADAFVSRTGLWTGTADPTLGVFSTLTPLGAGGVVRHGTVLADHSP